MLNKVILMGRLTRDPDFKATPSGTSVCNFSLAVDRDFVRQGEERQTDFINIVTFGSRDSSLLFAVAFRQEAGMMRRQVRKDMLPMSLQTRCISQSLNARAVMLLSRQTHLLSSRRTLQVLLPVFPLQ